MADKAEFNAPADVVEEVEAEALVGPGALLGSWHACDSATRGLVRIDIAAAGQAVTVHAFGACVPSPCDWGSVHGLAYAADVSSTAAIAFSAHYKFKFKET